VLNFEVREQSLHASNPTIGGSFDKGGKSRLDQLHPELHGAPTNALAFDAIG